MKKVKLTEYDAVGLSFGLLKVAGKGGLTNRSHTLWRCVCACGNETTAEMSDLTSGKKKSCGCLKNGSYSITHGATTPDADPRIKATFRIWVSIRQRCNNPKNRAYKWYGARGIKISALWDTFSQFLADMGPCEAGYSIERRDVNRGYESNNCYWLGRNKQQENKQNTLYVMYKDKRWRFKALCEHLNLKYLVVYKRYKLRGWTLEESFETYHVKPYTEDS